MQNDEVTDSDLLSMLDVRKKQSEEENRSAKEEEANDFSEELPPASTDELSDIPPEIKD